MGGSISGMQYKLEGQAYQNEYPNGHAGQAVMIPWSDFRNYKIIPNEASTVTSLQVHGTNYHWQGTLMCNNISYDKPPAAPESLPVTEPVPAPAPVPTPVPAPPPAPVQEEVAKPEDATPPPAAAPTPSPEEPEVAPAAMPEEHEGIEE